MLLAPVSLHDPTGRYLFTGYFKPEHVASKAVVLFFGELAFVRDEDGKYIQATTASTNYIIVDPIRTERKPGTTIGNDDYLGGQPQNILEAAETYNAFFVSASDFHEIFEMDELQWVNHTHMESGMFIRNSWFLWWKENHNCKQWPESCPPLVSEFNKLGITHPDDMSSIIIAVAYRMANGSKLEYDDLIEKAKNHWRHFGFPDGIFKNDV